MAELEHRVSTSVDTSQFHNYAIEWASTGIRLFIDGVEWANVANGAITNVRGNIQDMPTTGQLVIGLDNYTGASGLRDATMEIEWARAYTLTSTGGGGGGGGGTVPEKTQAAQFILDRLNSGGSINEDWSWSGAPTIVGTYNDDLLAEFDAAHPSDSTLGSVAKAWLADYIAAHGGTGGGGGGTRQVGPGGVATPAGATLTTSNSGSQLNISSGGTSSNPKVYDGQSHTVGRINITADWVVVQNFFVDANNQYGIFIEADNVVVQNCDVKGLTPTGDGDLNCFTAFGDNIKILYNNCVDFVDGDPGGSHTDWIQTWVSSSHSSSSNGWEIVGNIATGPDNPDRDNGVASIHQCIMVEGQGRGGNSGGSGGHQSDWLIADNTFGDSWNQCIKFDCDGDGIVITRNKFVGSSDRVIEDDTSGGITFYADNQITGDYGTTGISITPGSGPPATSV